jgi:hypothetical protein
VNVFKLAENGAETVIAVDGLFDGEAASRLCELYLQPAQVSRSKVVVDLSLAREVTYVALAVLTDLRRGTAGRVHLRGLPQRHSRMLQYLEAGEQATSGLDAAALAETASVALEKAKRAT